MNMPRIAPENVNNAPTIGDHSPQAHASVQDRAGLYIGIVGLIIAALALGMVVANQGRIDDLSSFYEQRTTQLQQDFASKLAAVQQQADLSTYYTMELDGKLMQRQLIKPEESFSGRRLQRSKAKQQQETQK